MVQPAGNDGFISAESDGESETASYFRAPFTQLPPQSSAGEEVDGDCPPPVRVLTPPSIPAQRRSVNFPNVLINPMEPPQPYTHADSRTPTTLPSRSNSSNVLIQPMEPPLPSVQDENRTPDLLANGQSMGLGRTHRRSNVSVQSWGQPATIRPTPLSASRASSSDRSLTRGEGREIRAGLSNLTEMVLNVSAQFEKMKKRRNCKTTEEGQTVRAGRDC